MNCKKYKKLKNRIKIAEAEAKKAELCIEKIKTSLAFGIDGLAWSAIEDWEKWKKARSKEE